MIIRYLSAAFVGVAITTALIWVMHILVEVSEAAGTDPGDRRPLVIGRTVIETPTSIDDVQPPERLPPPVDPPPLVPPAEPNGDGETIGIPTTAGTPAGPVFERGVFGPADSALINIITAHPDYPPVAARKGLEGQVIVQFDVTELGTVENAVVVETTSTLFNKAAVRAAYRSRYKPKTVDGVPQRTHGLRKLFRFEMET